MIVCLLCHQIVINNNSTMVYYFSGSGVMTTITADNITARKHIHLCKRLLVRWEIASVQGLR